MNAPESFMTRIAEMAGQLTQPFEARALEEYEAIWQTLSELSPEQDELAIAGAIVRGAGVDYSEDVPLEGLEGGALEAVRARILELAAIAYADAAFRVGQKRAGRGGG